MLGKERVYLSPPCVPADQGERNKARSNRLLARQVVESGDRRRQVVPFKDPLPSLQADVTLNCITVLIDEQLCYV